MDFREEYKKSAEVLSPSEEQIQRMTAGVMERIEKGTEKKPFPFRKIAYIGGAAAACAAITLAAVNILPKLSTNQLIANTITADTTAGSVNSGLVLADSADYADDVMASSSNGIAAFEGAGANDDAPIDKEAIMYEEAAVCEEGEEYDECDMDGGEVKSEENAVSAPDTGAPTTAIATTQSTANNGISAPEEDAKENPGMAMEPSIEAAESDEDNMDCVSALDATVDAAAPTEPTEPTDNPSTGADPDILAAWENELENSPLLCIDDYDPSEPLERLEDNGDVITLKGQNYALQSGFSMSDEQVAELPFEYFTGLHYGESEHVYKVFFAEDRCFVLFMQEDVTKPIKLMGEYIRVQS